MGDGVLAYFGWPIAHEEDGERAVRAGLDLTRAVAGLHAPDGQPLAARVGIAIGLVMVGELIGEGEAQVVGATPNLAAGLQGLAGAGQVVIAEPTARLTGGNFDLAGLSGRSRSRGSTCRFSPIASRANSGSKAVSKHTLALL
jgi:class 3 adenylate cyclase